VGLEGSTYENAAVFVRGLTSYKSVSSGTRGTVAATQYFRSIGQYDQTEPKTHELSPPA
jgi:hypothetical protein